MNRQINISIVTIILSALVIFSACSKSNSSGVTADPNTASFNVRGTVYKAPVMTDTLGAGTLLVQYPGPHVNLPKDSAVILNLIFMSPVSYISQFRGDFSFSGSTTNTVYLIVELHDTIFTSHPSTIAEITSNDGKTIKGTFSGTLQSETSPTTASISVTNGIFSVNL